MISYRIFFFSCQYIASIYTRALALNETIRKEIIFGPKILTQSQVGKS
jgi:hypothetical protein